MIHGMKILWESTYTLNPEKATADGYANWTHVACTETGALFKRSNTEGNGQRWDYLGRIDLDTQVVRMADKRERDARIASHAMSLLGSAVNGGTFGAAHNKATMLLPVTNKATGRKLTAAPSILNGSPTRDKNVNQMRIMVAGITMGCGGNCNPNEYCRHCGA